MTIQIFIPQDRLRAIANGTSLPDRMNGSVLFADISGFTALTESLIRSFGKRQGTEKLSSQLETVYTALIKQVEATGGSVVGFAGDAITCWWEGSGSALKTATAALGMQAAMQEFPGLELQTGIASGPVRRFVVGDPAIQQIDLLAGETVARASAVERLAKAGRVLADGTTIKALGESVRVSGMQGDLESGEKFGHITSLSVSLPVMEASTAGVDETQLHGWLHSVVAGNTRKLLQTDLRPCTALFIKFAGIDFEADDAGEQLQFFIRTAQRSAERHGGILLDIVIGDKGNYTYINFGALSAHEDNSRRAIKVALELQKKTGLQLQMGLAQGVMRVGAYGGETRKVFGALGDDVNLAARLMQTAAVGEILVSGHVHKAVINDVVSEPRPALTLKGKAELITVFGVAGERHERAVRLQEPRYSLPMVGRVQELKLIEEKLDLAVEGKSQVVAVIAEAGLGKSRLVAEVIRTARRKGFVGFGGACQSDGIHTPYQAWKSIWQAFFDVDPEQPLRKQMRWLEGEIEDRAPSRVDAMPLLNVVLDLNIPENDFTQNLEPKIRQSALHALLEECLKVQAKDEPTLIVIEDLHWLDALSHDLLEQLAKALANYAVCFVLAYRQPSLLRLQEPRLEALEQFTRIELHELTQAEAESAIRAKLAQLYPARGGALPQGLVNAMMTRSQGNPFYLEELLNYVRDLGLDPAAIGNIELPDSLHTLILSRIDQLSEQEQTTLRVASIVGRSFRARWLTGFYPELGSFPQVKTALDALEALDITPLDSPEPELAYLFKHIVTHEVTYESLPFTTRTRLHEQLARYLENVDAPVEAIAFHYGRSGNKDKQIEYLRKVGEVSQKNYANDAALEYYGLLLPILKDDKEKFEIHLKRGEVYEFTGHWDEAEDDYLAALESAKGDLELEANAQYALGKLCRLRGDYEPGLKWLGQAKKAYSELASQRSLRKVLVEIASTYWRTSQLEKAHEIFHECLAQAREEDDKEIVISILLALGAMETIQSNYPKARALFDECLVLYREIGDRRGIARVLGNSGNIAFQQGDYESASALYQDGLVLTNEMGDKPFSAMMIGNLGNIALTQGDYLKSEILYKDSLNLYREIGGKLDISRLLVNIGLVKMLNPQSDNQSARAFFEESRNLSKEIGNKEIWAYAMLGLGLIDLKESSPDARENILNSLRLRNESGEQYTQISSLVGTAGLVLNEGKPQFAAQLLGAIESALKRLNAVVEVDVKSLQEQTLANVKQTLGETAFQSAWEEGSRWTLDKTVKKVLEDGDGT